MTDRNIAAWQDHEVEELARLFAVGYSVARIAHMLGRSRSSVMGKIHRTKELKESTSRLRRPLLSMQMRQPAVVPVCPARPRPTYTPPADLPNYNVPRALRNAPWKPIDGQGPVALDDLRDQHCRWPVETGTGQSVMSCGAPKFGGTSYCRQHHLLSIRPRPVRGS